MNRFWRQVFRLILLALCAAQSPAWAGAPDQQHLSSHPPGTPRNDWVPTAGVPGDLPAPGTRLTLLHFNDFHGQLEAYQESAGGQPVAGLARMAHAIERIRAEAPDRPLVLLFAGDLLQGTVTSSLFMGIPDVILLNDLGVDAAALGNHELDFGQDIFRRLSTRARFPILAANVRAAPQALPVSPQVILQPPGGPRVAVLGLTTTQLTTTTHPRNAIGLTVEDPVAVAAGRVPELRAQADLVVVLSHLGVADDRRLAREVKGIDLVVGGHSHAVHATPLMENGVPILQAGERGRYLGRMDLVLKDGRLASWDYRLISLDAAAPEDDWMAREIRGIVTSADMEILTVVGRATTDLDARRESIRRSESNFGDLVADIARDLTGAQVALFNGGGFRASIPAGDIRLKDIYQAFPFRDELVTGGLDGAALLRALERSAALDPASNSGGFLQVSGLSYVISGGRVSEAKVAGLPLDRSAVYRVALPDFLAEGGDGYDMFKSMKDKNRTGRLISDMLIDAIRDRGTIAPVTDGRIQRR